MDRIVYVVDAQPIVGAYRGEAFRPVVEAVLDQAVAGRLDLRLTSVNAGEILYAVERALGAQVAREALRSIQMWGDIVNADLELAARAAWLKLRGGISFADCFAAALAHRDGVPLLTGDPEFRRVEDVVQIAWLDSLSV